MLCAQTFVLFLENLRELNCDGCVFFKWLRNLRSQTLVAIFNIIQHALSRQLMARFFNFVKKKSIFEVITIPFLPYNFSRGLFSTLTFVFKPISDRQNDKVSVSWSISHINLHIDLRLPVFHRPGRYFTASSTEAGERPVFWKLLPEAGILKINILP